MASIKENFRKAAKLRGYNLNDAAKYLGMSSINLSRALDKGLEFAVHLLEKIRDAPYKEVGIEMFTSGDINSGQITNFKLPKVGTVLRQGDDVMTIVRHLNETDAVADVQHNNSGPRYRREVTIKPHNRLNWAGLWEATGAVKGSSSRRKKK